jgi:hypothetical protein
MTDTSPQPVEERLADRVSGRHVGVQRGLRLLGQLDRAAYRAVAQLATPPLDRRCAGCPISPTSPSRGSWQREYSLLLGDRGAVAQP